METTKSTEQAVTVLDRANAALASLHAAGDPSDVQIAVDGVCPTEGCGSRLAVDVRTDLRAIDCTACGGHFELA